jgi:hypothetical protein
MIKLLNLSKFQIKHLRGMEENKAPFSLWGLWSFAGVHLEEEVYAERLILSLDSFMAPETEL